ncbi:MAG TPA: hypothetical protein VMZ52_13155 [Bryobacteraceae bacterium]|nr:hypothetical protein [Bryobacteraceae bacterium]
MNWPVFAPGESPYRDSIETGYTGMSRFIAEHPDPWGWNPLPYGGLPTQFLYLPLVHYATAVITWITHIPHEWAYRLLTAGMTCAGPVSVFLFAFYFTRSRLWALVAAVGYTFFSPSYGLVNQINRDRGGITHLPWHWHVFVKYGEGPHNFGLTLIPLALTALWKASTTARSGPMALAAILLASVTLTNWVAGFALAFCCLILLLSAPWAPDAAHFRARHLLGTAGLAYLMACFWLTPGFIRTTALNWPADAFNYHLQRTQWILLASLVVGTLLLRAFLWWNRVGFYLTFVTLCLFGFGAVVVTYYSYGIDTIPESRRYALEFELFLALAIAGWFQAGMLTGERVKQFCVVFPAVVMVATGYGQARDYVLQGWRGWKPVIPETTAEYRTAQWIAAQHPNGRVLASGGLRFRLNSWFDLHQVGGSFESGLRNRTPVNYAYQIRTGLGSEPAEEVQDALREMKAIGAEYVVMHGRESTTEYYRDYKNSKKFDGVLPKVYSDAGTSVYKVPGSGMAHLVKGDEFPKGTKPSELALLAQAIDDPNRPSLKVFWLTVNDIEIRGPAPPGMLVTLAVNYDPGWIVTQDSSRIYMDADALGFMKLHPVPSASSIFRLHYNGTREQKIAAGVSASAWLGTILWLLGDSRRRFLQAA